MRRSKAFWKRNGQKKTVINLKNNCGVVQAIVLLFVSSMSSTILKDNGGELTEIKIGSLMKMDIWPSGMQA
jgi:hypothetical protein